MLSPIIANAPINAVLFAVEGGVMQQLADLGWDDEAASSHAVAGAISGLSQAWLAGPSELVKIQLQCRIEGGGTPWGAARAIVREEGAAGLTRGLSVTVLRDVPAFAIYFASYSALKRRLAEAHPLFRAAAGEAVPSVAAGAGASGGVMEIEHAMHRPEYRGDRGGWARRRQEVRLPMGPSVWGEQMRVTVPRPAATSPAPAPPAGGATGPISTPEGSPAPSGPSADRPAPSGPSAAVRAAAAEAASEGPRPGPLAQLLAGGLAGTASWLFLHPADVLKSVVQQQTPQTPSDRRGPVRALRFHLAQSGPSFLLRGIVPTCLRAFPASAVIFFSYETIRPALPF